ncbi:hypothetical protein DUNSADRAFT_16187 [Dunaliella salina]|uniref:Uncharacterized protein n=1 Tax=Dunaliella salina TaxID=3046 RepID=A0ABQ7G441_DUNSA|nr:hypothetical protein DUNSADRAFT_16187 [Dunaliella salina]|eukprot:KAF5829366.1 hypothetical protein DUNSADRAFT_16187 [Dunaliella salina]
MPCSRGNTCVGHSYQHARRPGRTRVAGNDGGEGANQHLKPHFTRKCPVHAASREHPHTHRQQFAAQSMVLKLCTCGRGGEEQGGRHRASAHFQGHLLSAMEGRPDVQVVRPVSDVYTEKSFQDLALSPAMTAALAACGFERPSPVQEAAIPLGRVGSDLIIQAKSGTGKTAVFAIICLERLKPEATTLQALIVSPTREIAIQSEQVISRLAAGLPEPRASSAVFIGGLPTIDDEKRLRRVCHIAVGTPGRLCQLIQAGSLRTENITMFVLDEADALLGESLYADVTWIYDLLPRRKQVMALSATYTPALLEDLEPLMKRPQRVMLCEESVALHAVSQFYCLFGAADAVGEQAGSGLEGQVQAAQGSSAPLAEGSAESAAAIFQAKVGRLVELLAAVPFHQAAVFCNQKPQAEWLARKLSAAGFPAAYLAADRTQTDRIEAMDAVRGFKLRVIVSTDVMARGVDLARVNLVINLDLPHAASTYMHRVGRTGRFGSRGICISFVTPSELAELNKYVEQAQGGTVQPLPPSSQLMHLMEQDLGSEWERQALHELSSAPVVEPPPPPPSFEAERAADATSKAAGGKDTESAAAAAAAAAAAERSWEGATQEELDAAWQAYWQTSKTKAGGKGDKGAAAAAAAAAAERSWEGATQEELDAAWQAYWQQCYDSSYYGGSYGGWDAAAPQQQHPECFGYAGYSWDPHSQHGHDQYWGQGPYISDYSPYGAHPHNQQPYGAYGMEPHAGQGLQGNKQEHRQRVQQPEAMGQRGKGTRDGPVRVEGTQRQEGRQAGKDAGGIAAGEAAAAGASGRVGGADKEGAAEAGELSDEALLGWSVGGADGKNTGEEIEDEGGDASSDACSDVPDDTDLDGFAASLLDKLDVRLPDQDQQQTQSQPRQENSATRAANPRSTPAPQHPGNVNHDGYSPQGSAPSYHTPPPWQPTGHEYAWYGSGTSGCCSPYGPPPAYQQHDPYSAWSSSGNYYFNPYASHKSSYPHSWGPPWQTSRSACPQPPQRLATQPSSYCMPSPPYQPTTQPSSFCMPPPPSLPPPPPASDPLSMAAPLRCPSCALLNFQVQYNSWLVHYSQWYTEYSKWYAREMAEQEAEEKEEAAQQARF